MRCVTCNRVLIPTPSGAVCLDHGGLVPLPVLVRELRRTSWTIRQTCSARLWPGRC